MIRLGFVLITLGIATALPAHAASPLVEGAPTISEVLYNPLGADTGAEAVEIHNPTLVAIDLAGYTLADDDSCRIGNRTEPAYSLALDGTIPPLGYLTVRLASVGSTPKCLALANAGDIVILRGPAGAVVDSVAWPRDAPAAVEEGLSVQRCPLGLPRAWTAGPPTLGAPNGLCAPA